MIAVGRPRLALRATQGLALAGLAAYAAQAVVAVCGRSADAFFETYVYTSLILLGAGLCLARAARERSERAPGVREQRRERVGVGRVVEVAEHDDVLLPLVA